MSVLSLPDEICVKIFLNCDILTLGRVARSCRRFYHCSNSIGIWKLKWNQLASGLNTLPLDQVMYNYKTLCKRFCSVFGTKQLTPEDRLVLSCSRCQSLCCSLSCVQERDEMIIFDFGSKTTWFKYASDNTGQISMHPTVGPVTLPAEGLQSSRFDSSILSGECCPVCTRIIMRCLPRPALHSQGSPDSDAEAAVLPSSQGSKVSRAFSKLSFCNLNCLTADAASSEVDKKLLEEADCIDGSNGLDLFAPQSGQQQNLHQRSMATERNATDSQFHIYQFLVRHMLKRNPFFNVPNISFVVCEPTDCTDAMKSAFVELLLRDLKVPALCFMPKCVGVALYTGIDTCLVVDSGAHRTLVSPVVELQQVRDRVETLDCGGSYLSTLLLDCIRLKGFGSEIREGNIDSSQVKRECYIAYNAQVESRRKIVPREIAIKGSASDRQKMYEVKLSHELYQLPEQMYLALDLPRVILSAVAPLPVGVQKRLLSNIVLTGGNCRLTGLGLRLSADLQKSAPPDLATSVHVVDPRLMTGRSDAVIGSSYVKRWPHAEWVTRMDYIMADYDGCRSNCAISSHQLFSGVQSVEPQLSSLSSRCNAVGGADNLFPDEEDLLSESPVTVSEELFFDDAYLPVEEGGVSQNEEIEADDYEFDSCDENYL